MGEASHWRPGHKYLLSGELTSFTCPQMSRKCLIKAISWLIIVICQKLKTPASSVSECMEPVYHYVSFQEQLLLCGLAHYLAGQTLKVSSASTNNTTTNTDWSHTQL